MVTVVGGMSAVVFRAISGCTDYRASRCTHRCARRPGDNCAGAGADRGTRSRISAAPRDQGCNGQSRNA